MRVDRDGLDLAACAAISGGVEADPVRRRRELRALRVLGVAKRAALLDDRCDTDERDGRAPAAAGVDGGRIQIASAAIRGRP